MNEQDFNQWLRSKTDATPIPEHLLPEYIAEDIQQTKHKDKWYKNPWVNIGAACLLVCITVLSVWSIHFKKYRNEIYNMSSNSDVHDKNSDTPLESEESEAYIESDFSPSSASNNIRTAASYRQLYQILKTLTPTDDYCNDFITDADENMIIKNETQENSSGNKNEIANSSPDQDASYYDTNAQTAQVAEADIVKTDGSYIYSAYCQRDYNLNAVAIAKAEDGILETCSIISAESIQAGINCDTIFINEMYVTNHKLILLCHAWNNMPDAVSYSYYNNRCNTYILIYNVSNAENPELLSSLMQEGTYHSSRLTNGYLYTFTEKREVLPDMYQKYDEYVPHTEDSRLTCNDIYLPECPDSSCYQIMTGMALEQPEHFTASKAIVSGNGTYYVSHDNIFFAHTGWENGVATTELLKFRYIDGTITPEGSATISGHLLNQFAMDEYNGYLRVAATVTAGYNSISDPVVELYEDTLQNSALTDTEQDRIIPGESVKTNALYVIDSNMDLVGTINNLAPDERIYSVRFMGDVGYFVTYRETDPLFSVDLSDPANPTIMDALKIPGFSNYLHFYSEDLLFGLGEEINPATGAFMGLKLSMFDISDPYHIRELDKTILSDAYDSTATYNHKSLLIDPERNIIGFYTFHYDNTTYEYKEQYSIYSYTEGTGFENLFACSLNENEFFSEYADESDAYECIRGLYIGDYLYLVLGNRICSYTLDTFDKVDSIIIW